MRLILQRVNSASVRVDSETIAKIGPGILVLVGVERGDGAPQVAKAAEKLSHLRIFEDPEGRMNLEIRAVGGELLIVSQFTLAGSTRRGRRPSFSRAADPDLAEPLYLRFVERLRERGVPVETGIFQAMMQVELVNDGPVTLLLDPRDVPRSAR